MSRKSFHLVFTRRVGLYLALGLVLSNAVFLGIVSRSLGKSYSDAFQILKFTEETALRQALLIDALLLLLIGGLVFLASLLMSHRISGPVYRFEKSAESVAGGDLSVSVRLRKKDELKDIAGDMEEAIAIIRDKMQKIRQSAEEIKAAAESLEKKGREAGPGEENLLRTLKEKSGEINASLEFFKE